MVKILGGALGSLLLTAVWVGSAGWVQDAVADDISSCFDEGRNTDLCLQMRHMRNLIHGLESQKELLHVDYSYLVCVSNELDDLLGRILRSASGSTHIRALEDIRSVVRLTRRRSEEQNLEAFRLLGHIQTHCQRCHTEQAPPGRRWEDLSRASWPQISLRCNEAVRNPYLCKQMYGMLAQVQLLESGLGLGTPRYETMAAAAGEIERISNELTRLGGVHGGVTEPLQRISQAAGELKSLSQGRNPEALNKASQVSQTCRECHLQPEAGAR
jgi:hypothetical protein